MALVVDGAVQSRYPLDDAGMVWCPDADGGFEIPLEAAVAASLDETGCHPRLVAHGYEQTRCPVEPAIEVREPAGCACGATSFSGWLPGLCALLLRRGPSGCSPPRG